MAALERRWAPERDKHERQVQPWRFFAGRGTRSSATVTPAPLRFWSYAPPRTWVIVAATVAIAAFLGYQWQFRDGPMSATDLIRFLAIVALLLLVSVTRITVSQHGVSFDIAGIRRVSCYGFLAIGAIIDAAAGPRPADWPKGRPASSWFPGARHVHLLYNVDGKRAVKSCWVRDPERFGVAVLGRPMRERAAG